MAFLQNDVLKDTLAIAGLAIGLFAATNIDNMFVLLSFFSDGRFRAGQIVIGQYIGIATLFVIGLVASLASLIIAPAYIGLLGLAPIAIGLAKLRNLRRDSGGDTGIGRLRARSAILSVAAVTIANGGDTISIYTSLFAVRPVGDMTVIAVVYFAMAALWLVLCHWLTEHPTLGIPIRRYGPRVIPFVLVGLGIFIMAEAGTFHLLHWENAHIRVTRQVTPARPAVRWQAGAARSS